MDGAQSCNFVLERLPRVYFPMAQVQFIWSAPLCRTAPDRCAYDVVWALEPSGERGLLSCHGGGRLVHNGGSDRLGFLGTRAGNAKVVEALKLCGRAQPQLALAPMAQAVGKARPKGKIVARAHGLLERERSLHRGLHPDLQKVLAGKNIIHPKP